jgi:hypothetical protein
MPKLRLHAVVQLRLTAPVHRNVSAAPGSSRPAAMRRNASARLRSSGRAYSGVPSHLVLKEFGASLWPAVYAAFALSISPMPTRQIASHECGAGSGISMSARDAQLVPSAYITSRRTRVVQVCRSLGHAGVGRVERSRPDIRQCGHNLIKLPESDSLRPSRNGNE